MGRLAIFILLATLTGLSGYANAIDPNSIGDPLFDGSLADVPVAIKAGASLYPFYESTKPVGKLIRTTLGRIVGRKLFPSNFTNDQIAWWYYVNYKTGTEDNFYWIKDSDFAFEKPGIMTGVYSFTSFVPRNDLYRSLAERDIQLYVRPEPSSDGYELFLGRLNDGVFVALSSSSSTRSYNENYLQFVFCNYTVLFPKVSSPVVLFMDVRADPYGAEQSGPQIQRVQGEVPVSLASLILGLGEVTSSYVRIRDEPSQDSPYSARRLMESEMVEILARSAQEEKIGSLQAPWYKIRTFDGVVGWSYGGYIRPTKQYDSKGF